MRHWGDPIEYNVRPEAQKSVMNAAGWKTARRYRRRGGQEQERTDTGPITPITFTLHFL